jgi:hypothetical protein
VSNHPANGKRVVYLVELLRRRTPEEITAGVMALAGSFTPEMWRALELLRLERGANTNGRRRSENVPGIGATMLTVSVDDEV